MIPKNERKIMIDFQDKMSVSKQCKILDLNRNFLYYSPKGESEQSLKIMRMMDQKYLRTPFYGFRKLKVWLKSEGFIVNSKKVKRLMKTINWQTIYREPKTSIGNLEHKKYPYLLRDLKITRANQVWATDITYIPMERGFMYLNAIIDLHTRLVLNWSISNTMSANWCAELLQETIDKYGKPDIFNTDQGSQYTSDVHTKILLDNEIQISMDGKGRAIDNIFIERLWRTVKYEDVYLQCYSDAISLYKGLKKYFEFYNNERFHQSLDYQTPAQMYRKTEVA